MSKANRPRKAMPWGYRINTKSKLIWDSIVNGTYVKKIHGEIGTPKRRKK